MKLNNINKWINRQLFIIGFIKFNYRLKNVLLVPLRTVK